MELSPPELSPPALRLALPCICAWQVTANSNSKTRAGPADKACFGPLFGFRTGFMQFYRGKDSNLAKDIGFATEEYRCKSRPGGLNSPRQICDYSSRNGESGREMLVA